MNIFQKAASFAQRYVGKEQETVATEGFEAGYRRALEDVLAIVEDWPLDPRIIEDMLEDITKLRGGDDGK